MIGTSPLKLIYDDLSHFNGYIHIYTKHNDRMAPVAFCLRSDALETIERIEKHSTCDYYITANCTIADRRQSAYLLSYNNIVVDVDCHNETVDVFMRNHSINTLIFYLQQSDIPQPTIIHKTGRGVQLWWHIEQISSKLFFLYDKACELLCSAISAIIAENPTFCGCLDVDYGASKNAVGLFRLFDTYNTKTLTKTEYTTSENTYTIHSLLNKLNESEDTPKPQQIEYKKPVIRCIDCDYLNLHKGRLNILEQLASEQEGEGMREIILFLYYNSSWQLYDEDIAQQQTRSLNNEYLHLPNAELLHIFSCDKLYKYKKKTFCDVLGITSAYYDEYSNKAKNEREEKREEQRMEKAKKRAMARTLKQSGEYTNEEIAELTGYSLRTIEGIKTNKTQEPKPWEILGISKATYYRRKKDDIKK